MPAAGPFLYALPGMNQRGRSLGDVLFFVIVGAVLLGVLVLMGIRVADVYYKAGWMAAHFPPPAELCNEPFCLKTNAVNDLGGDWRFGELHFAYCPKHLPSGFQGRGGRSAAMVVLVGALVVIGCFVSVPIVGGLFRIAAWPVLVPMWTLGKIPLSRLVPFSRYRDVESKPGDWLEPAGMVTGAVVAVVAMALYCWW